jgi:hypothetical protein
VRIKQRGRRGEETLLVRPGRGAAVCAVSQIGEVAEEFRGVLQVGASDVGFLTRTRSLRARVRR